MRSRAALLHALRTLALGFLVLQAALQLRDVVDPWFQVAALAAGVLVAVGLERARIRMLPAFFLAAAVPVLLRAALQLAFGLEARLAPGPAADLAPVYFDRDLVPALLPYAAGWLTTFLALRRPAFAFFEAGANGALLVAILATQARYHLTLYPHPALFAAALAGFLLVEIAVLVSARSMELSRELGLERRGPGRRAGTLRPVLSFAWVVVPLILVFLFFLLGQYREGAVTAGGGLMKPTLFRFDFSPFVRLESEIRTSEEPVLLLRVEGQAQRWLLRRFVLSGYDPRQGFFADRKHAEQSQPAVVPDDPVQLPDPGWAGRRAVEQEYFFLSIDPTSLVAVNLPVEVTPLANWRSSSFLRVYRVRSLAQADVEQVPALAAPPSMPVGELAYYTRYGGDQRIHELALQVVEGIPGYAGRVQAIEQWLKENYRYSLKPGPATDGNQLHHFLFESRKGYCSYFAFAMALMCRSLGIPARVAVGFLVPPETEVLNFYQVNAFQAHAWVEVWFGDRGWIELDPTSQVVASGEDVTFYQGPDPEKLAKLIQEVLDHQQGMDVERSSPAEAASALARVVGGVARALSALARWWYVVVPAAWLVALAALKAGPALLLLASADPRRRARGAHRLALAGLAGVGLRRGSRETPLEFARRLGREHGIELEPLTAEWLQAAFSPRFGAGEEAAVRAARRAFAESFRRAVRPARRIAGLASPRGILPRERR